MLTWKQFIREVESKGVKDDDEIFYIDVSNCPNEGDIDVSFDDNNNKREVSISC